ncbi:hypothetical protein [Patiriisocius sp. Uisw_017]|jgi:hypothetical protein|uniref:hypothetical protein n=1 Tax=Patiriisocius sp. Uisw_017 TaxID=3230968 RepID=UPI0039EC66A0
MLKDKIYVIVFGEESYGPDCPYHLLKDFIVWENTPSEFRFKIWSFHSNFLEIQLSLNAGKHLLNHYKYPAARVKGY